MLTITAQNGGLNAPLSQKYRVVNGQGLQYDADGNLINDGRFGYSWDAANRLIQITVLHPTANNPAHTSKFTNDGLGRRVEDQEYTGVDLVQDRKFIYDLLNIRAEQDQHNNVMKRFYGNGFQVMSGGNIGNYYYDRDYLYSVRNVLDTNGNVAISYDCDSWGNRSRTAGTFDSDFGYAGYFEQSPSGLAFTTFRAYSPLMGRWVNRDPFEELGGVNLYGVFSKPSG